MHLARAGFAVALRSGQASRSLACPTTSILPSSLGSHVSLAESSTTPLVTRRFAHPRVLEEIKREPSALRSARGASRSPPRDRGDEWRSAPRRARSVVIPDFSAPLPPDKDFVKQTLSKHITDSFNNASANYRADSWGLRGPAYQQLAERLCPEDWRRQASSRNILACLIDRWATEAIDCLETKTALSLQSSPHPIWNMDQVIPAYEAEGAKCLDRLCTQSLLHWLRAHFVSQGEVGLELAHLRHLLSTVDLRDFPLQFPLARSMVRNIHLHVGPTNSGKTHGALVALCKANTGLYAGPLRLLAHEVWDRINTGKVSPEIAARACNLTTGEEVRSVDQYAGLQACTVEMIGMNSVVDVAVIDEIQMIADESRGGAWSNAVVGVPAKELHLCGESSVVPLIKALADACGDRVHVHEYERLTPLRLGKSLHSNLGNIRKGDCLVAFSRSEIFKLKRLIEEISPFKCAVAYGALPPETKAEQAKLFNDPDNDYSVMVASDAIGMGLNLKIKRVIFHSVTKWNGSQIVPISGSQLKQIAGRAGRFGTSIDQEEGGYATTFHSDDLPILDAALKAPLLPIPRAGLHQRADTIGNFASLMARKRAVANDVKANKRGLHKILQDLSLVTQIDSRFYFACSMEQQTSLAPILEEVVPLSMDLTISEREKLAIAPANTRDERLMALMANMVGFYVRGGLVSFAKADESLGMLLELGSVERMRNKHMEILEASSSKDDNETSKADKSTSSSPSSKVTGKVMKVESLMILESLHRGLNLYLWLSYRFPAAFSDRASMEKIKLRTERAIDFCLTVIQDQERPRWAGRNRIAGVGGERFGPKRGDSWTERKREDTESKLSGIGGYTGKRPPHKREEEYSRSSSSSGADALRRRRRLPPRVGNSDTISGSDSDSVSWRKTAERSVPFERDNGMSTISRPSDWVL